MANTFVHGELHTTDVKAAKKFYKGLFDWKLEDMKMGSGMAYTMIKSGTKGIGGMMAKMMPEEPTAWLHYVAVDSVEKTVGKARKLGANVMVDRTEIPGMGAFAILMDPAGAPVGVWEASRKRPARRKPAAKKKK
jgi:predicted enzyme related to lactoylglutathione lyase